VNCVQAEELLLVEIAQQARVALGLVQNFERFRKSAQGAQVAGVKTGKTEPAKP
jgi:hypothetical protein